MPQRFELDRPSFLQQQTYHRATAADRTPRDYRPPPFVQQHADRFMDQVVIPELDVAQVDHYYASCWTWTGTAYLRKDLVFRPQSRWIPIHRFAYELHVGVVPEGFVARTACESRTCVTPRHLALRPRNHSASAISADARAAIRSLVHDHNHGIRELAGRFGLSPTTIGRIAREHDA
jgi:hypothetical protein